MIQLQRFSFVFLLVVFAACAPRNEVKPNSDRSDFSPTTTERAIPINTKMKNYGEMIVQGVKLENTSFDFPVVVNSRVEQWVDYFTGRGRKHFEKYLERSEYFIPYIIPILRQQGLPEDLVYLAMIESGFHNHARSFAKAVGPWQFIPATGKRYGLHIDWWVDERHDTRKSTEAAAAYLKELYGFFGSWELAAAGYNAGEMKVEKAIRRYGTTDFWSISRHRYFKPETRNYVPKIMAAAIVAKNRMQFGFVPPRAQPGPDEVIAPDGQLVKVQTDTNPSIPESEIQAMTQPEGSADITKETVVTPKEVLPEKEKEVLAEGEEPADEDDDKVAENENEEPAVAAAVLMVPEDNDSPYAKPVAVPSIGKRGEIMGEEVAEFEIKSPADLLSIAQAAELSYQTVKGLNPELKRWVTPPYNKTYRLKLPTFAKDKFLANYNHPNFKHSASFLPYKIKAGDTVSSIARRYRIKPEPILQLNGMSSVNQRLRNGTQIFLPLPTDRTRSIASLEVIDAPERRRRGGSTPRRKTRKEGVYQIRYEERERAKRGFEAS